MSASIPRRVRLLASVSLVLLSLVLIPVVLAAAGSLVALLTAPVGLAGAAAGAWWVITERMPRRALGILGVVIGTAVVAGAALAAADDGDGRAWEWALVAALAVGAAVCSRLALRATLHTIDLTRSFPEFRPRRAVLICSPWSGGARWRPSGSSRRHRPSASRSSCSTAAWTWRSWPETRSVLMPTQTPPAAGSPGRAATRT